MNQESSERLGLPSSRGPVTAPRAAGQWRRRGGGGHGASPSDALTGQRVTLHLITLSKKSTGSSRHGAAETKPTRILENVGSIPGLPQWVKDLALLWRWCSLQTWFRSPLLGLWCRPAAAASIGPLAWEPPGNCSQHPTINPLGKTLQKECVSPSHSAVQQKRTRHGKSAAT